MAEVIDHLCDPIGFLRQLRSYLKSNCTIFLTTPMGWRDPSKTNAYGTSSHLHFFSPESLDIALCRSGFYPLRADRFAKLPPRSDVAREVVHRVVAGIFAFIDCLAQPAPPSHASRFLQPPQRMPHSIQGVTGIDLKGVGHQLIHQ